MMLNINLKKYKNIILIYLWITNTLKTQPIPYSKTLPTLLRQCDNDIVFHIMLKIVRLEVYLLISSLKYEIWMCIELLLELI
jgi:hypothetical protein